MQFYTERDRNFIQALKAKGYTKEKAFAALDQVKAKRATPVTPIAENIAGTANQVQNDLPSSPEAQGATVVSQAKAEGGITPETTKGVMGSIMGNLTKKAPVTQAEDDAKNFLTEVRNKTPEEAQGAIDQYKQKGAILGNPTVQTAIGVFKGAAQTADTLSKPDQANQQELGERLNMPAFRPNEQIEGIRENLTTPSNDAQKVGFTVEKGAEYFIPAAVEAKAMDLLKQPGVLNKLKASGIMGATSGGVGMIQSEGEAIETLTAAGLGALVPIMVPIWKSAYNAGKKLLPGTEKNIANISEKIAPDLTKKEAQKALAEKRFVQGKDSVLFGKTPDKAIPKKSVQNAAKYIEEKIPGAKKMNESELYSAIGGEIKKKAETLKPEMKKMLLTNQQKEAAKVKWSELKTKQTSTPEFANSKLGGKQAQKQFEGFLDEMTSAGKDGKWKNLDDVWDVAKRYDDTIPENVKQAGVNSDSFLQLRKEMWLENRAILRDAINDASQGLGEVSKKAFKEMSELYEAQHNIMSKVKPNTKVKGGIFTKDNLKKGALYYGGGKLIEKTTGIDIPIL